MGFDLAGFHDRHRDEIIREWIRRLHTEISENYSRRPLDELTKTVTGAFDADYHLMVHNDYSRLNRFIDKITRMRLEAGFALSDVQKAFELYREIVVPILATETSIEDFQESISKINTCLAYTIHRFSDLFQKMHEKEIIEHNRRLEEEVRTRTAELRESERMAYIGQITTSLSHEIRNPLSAVTMNLQILRKNPRLKGNDQRRIDIAVKGVTRLERILKELLDFAKPLQLSFGTTDINQILSSCIELLEMKFEEKRLSVISSLDPAMPLINGDSGKLEQGFINLLLNALEASGNSGKIVVKSEYLSDNGRKGAEVAIEDEGSGIPENSIETIFKPFVTTKSKGTGLGLPMVQRIVEAHGGRVMVKNLVPTGASFKVHLPA